MGEVYRARDTKLEREVALKVLPASVATEASRLNRLEREAKTLAGLTHPHIFTLYSVEPLLAHHRLRSIHALLVGAR